MPKSRSTKSAGLQKSGFKKPSRKHRQPMSRKTVARVTKSRASTTSKKSSAKPPSPSVPKQGSRLKPLKSNVKIPAAARSTATNRRLAQLEKGKTVKKLFEQGYSHGELAKTFGCKTGVIRERIILGSLPEDLKEVFLEGKIDRKEVLKIYRARKNNGKSTVPFRPETPQRIMDLNPQPAPAAVVRTNETRQNPPSLMTEEDRQEKISEHAKLIVDWIHQTGLRPCDYRTFFKQVESALDGTRPWLFSNEAPKPHEIKPDEDPWKVINRYKVENIPSQSAPDVTNNAVTWLARWVQRLIPDRGRMKEAIAKAKALLLDRAQ